MHRLKDFSQGRQLGSIAYFGSGAMGLDQFERIGRDAGSRISPLHRKLLTSRPWRVNGTAASIAGGTHPLENCVNPVAIALRIGKPLEDQHAKAFAEDGAVAIAIERLRIATRRESRGFAEAHVHENIVEGINAAGNHHVRQAGGKFQACEVNCRERTGAGRVDHAVGAADIKPVRNPARRHISKQSGKRVLLPANIGIGNSLHHIFGNISVDAGVLERLAPARMPQACPQRNYQLQCTGNAENDTGTFAIELPSLVGAGGIPGID